MAMLKICQSKVMKGKRELSLRLKAANEVSYEIEMLMQDRRYLSENQIIQLKQRMEDELDGPLKILNEIGEIKANEGFLNEKR
jgi:hypothetical protein